MGDYINYNDVVARYGIFDTSSQSNVNSDSIYYAEKEVENELCTVYTIPFSDAYPTVKDLCIDMVYLRHLRRKDPKKCEAFEAYLTKRFENIRKGITPLVTNSGTLAPTASGADLPGSLTDGYHPIHSLLDAEDNQVDTDLLDYLEDERDDD